MNAQPICPEDDGEWFCKCPSEKNWNGYYVTACSICGAERPENLR